ncbi:AraC family transcriptional regulator [Photobacterium lutimaris]|uniref:AraC family transcriptional regulator n=1 Tax=Photobacterium lutimaris TaxID=388278 RepID=A0A2T3IZ50_9GAMM|nr:helix-turn-helix transcriptional regulator [Photobacterium lutimaris]PSU33914.1 AraC family transcriptional regulator [Photobacterium lutimaris]TDR76240.1 AraC family transcriptional regulator [Photobacterium lutimaris]
MVKPILNASQRQHRQVPLLRELPRPVYARVENWQQSGSQTHWHTHGWGQWSYAAEGMLIVHTRQGHYVAPPQFAIWIPEGIEHKVISNGAAQMRSLYIETKYLSDIVWSQPRVCSITPLVRELVLQFCALPANYDCNSADGRLAQVLLDQIACLPPAATQLTLPGDKRLATLAELLQMHPEEPRSIEQLGELVGLSGRSVSRLFKQQTGLTFQQWRQRARLLDALNRLESGSPVTRVSIECGYDSVSAFVSTFKKQFGVTPGKYLRKE